MTAPSSRGSEAQPESRPGERQPTFSFAAPASSAGSSSHPTVDAPPGAEGLAPPGNRFYAIARDPRCLFVYWELSPPIVRIPGAALALVIHRADGSHESTCGLEEGGGTRIVDVTRPGAPYTVILGYLAHGGLTRDDMCLVLAERRVETPRDRPLPSGGSKAEAIARLFPGTPDAATSSSRP